MNKDALLATLIGFGIGLLIMGTLLFGPDIAKSIPHIKLSSITLPRIQLPNFMKNVQPTKAPLENEIEFTIDSPLTDAIEAGEAVLVSGSAPYGSTVVMQNAIDEEVVVPNGDGKYAGKLNLEEGVNTINVTSYTEGTSKTLTVTVFYTQEEF